MRPIEGVVTRVQDAFASVRLETRAIISVINDQYSIGEILLVSYNYSTNAVTRVWRKEGDYREYTGDSQ